MLFALERKNGIILHHAHACIALSCAYLCALDASQRIDHHVPQTQTHIIMCEVHVVNISIDARGVGE